MALKRPADTVALMQETKKLRSEVELYNNRDKQLLEAVNIIFKSFFFKQFSLSIFQGIHRTSNLLSPIMALDGHQGEIFTCAFNTDGDYLVSSGFDRQICEYCCCCIQEVLLMVLFFSS